MFCSQSINDFGDRRVDRVKFFTPTVINAGGITHTVNLPPNLDQFPDCCMVHVDHFPNTPVIFDIIQATPATSAAYSGKTACSTRLSRSPCALNCSLPPARLSSIESSFPSTFPSLPFISPICVCICCNNAYSSVSML